MRLSAQHNAVILAHNYQTPEIFHTVADIVGDSLALAREAVNTDADVIVLAGVHFMAETAKLLNPGKTVLIPDDQAGCSLAESITAEDVRQLRSRYPGVPVVTYVNTSAAVKAESDICCTSGNAKKVIESLGVDRVIMLPDEFLAQNTAALVPEVEIITWAGHCEVHERFTAEDIREVRESYPGRGGAGPPGGAAGGGGGGGLRRIDRRHGRLRRREAPGPGGPRDRVLDERQRGGTLPGGRVRAALQPVPAHEAHHACPRSDGRSSCVSTRSRSIRRWPSGPGWRSSACSLCAEGLAMTTANPRDRVLVVGGGIAGLATALHLAPLPVTLLVASPLGQHASTPLAQGGIAAALGADDHPALHAADTLQAGAGLSDPDVAARVAAAAPSCIEWLIAQGTFLIEPRPGIA